MGTYVIKIMRQNFREKRESAQVLTIAKTDNFLVLTIATKLRKGGTDNCKNGELEVLTIAKADN